MSSAALVKDEGKCCNEYPEYYIYQSLPDGYKWLRKNGVFLVKAQYENEFKQRHKV